MDVSKIILVPYPDLKQTAECFDTSTLQRQRIVSQIALTFLGKTDWNGYPRGLVFFSYCMIQEMKKRNLYECTELFLKDRWPSQYHEAIEIWNSNFSWKDLKKQSILPKWFGGAAHIISQEILLHEDRAYYSKFDWDAKEKVG